MALEDILRAMELQVQAEIAPLHAEAEVEAAAILAQAEDEAKQIKARQRRKAVLDRGPKTTDNRPTH